MPTSSLRTPKDSPSLIHAPAGCGTPSIEIARGIRMGLPIVLGYLPLGFAYGVLAVKSGIPPLWAVAMSTLIFAGAGQFIAAGMIATGAPILSIVITNFMVNLRHILMSAALAPDVKPLGKLARTLFSLEVTDEVFAVHSTDFRHCAPCCAYRLFACNLTAHSGWIVGTAVGVFSGGLVADVRPWGLDYALTAMFLALLVPLCWERLHLLVALASAIFALGLTLAGAGRWSVILATILAASLGLWLSCRRDDHPGKKQPLASPPDSTPDKTEVSS